MSKNKKMARIAGALYLLVIASGLFAEVFVRQALRVPGNALATFQAIQHSAGLYRLGFVADLCNFAIGLPGVLIMYGLLSPANKYVARLALVFVVVQTAVIAANLLNQLPPLLYASSEASQGAFSLAQQAALSAQAISLQALGYGIGLFFFGFYCIFISYLLFRTALVPRVIGVLYALAGLSYIANSLVLFLSNGFENPYFPYFAVVSFVGELSLCLWLLVMGVRDMEAADLVSSEADAALSGVLMQPGA